MDYGSIHQRWLEDESVRDAALAVAGVLNLKMGGPSFLDMQVKNSNNAEFAGPDNTFNDNTNRRTIYRLWARSGNSPLLQAFDCPDPSVMAPIRSVTITPIQAMALMNNTRMEQCAERMAKRLASQDGNPLDRNIAFAWELLFARPPEKVELEKAVGFAKEHGMQPLCLVLLNTNEFLYIQ